MQRKRRLILFVTALAVVCEFLAIAGPLFAASKEKVLYSFNGADGAEPSSGLIFDAKGNLYGTTAENGYGSGNVFKLTPGSGGTWTETVLHNFERDDGYYPVAGLALDEDGNLYGTTVYGGVYGSGTVFQLANGTWTETVLHSFGQGTDGNTPYAGLTLDAHGNLYGTTTAGGAYNLGTVFEITPGNGTWTEKVLHSFRGNRKDGVEPWAGLIFDSDGNLYGTTTVGGAHNLGTVFEVTPGSSGTWTEKVLHSFNGHDGEAPYAGLIFDASRNLYGTTEWGGALGRGTVFQLMPGSDGTWTEKVLHSFNGHDGGLPVAGLIFDAAGNLYGTTYAGGATSHGTVFHLTPGTNGAWTEKVLHSFKENGKDGYWPLAYLIFDAAGNLYGTTNVGGAGKYSLYGTVFEITP